MRLLICPGYHSADVTHDFLQALLTVVTPEQLWTLPIDAAPWTRLLTVAQLPTSTQPLTIIAFSAGVVAAYPLALSWQTMGRRIRLIAMDGWGMPLLGGLEIYRLSHDPWTHHHTYFPTAANSNGYFYADPAVEHLSLWQAPQLAQGIGTLAPGPATPMTALEFICTVLTQPAATSVSAVS